MIRFGDKKVSTIVLSSFGHSGRGNAAYYYSKDYLRLIRTAKATKTTILTKSWTPRPRVGQVVPWNPKSWQKYVRPVGDCGLVNRYGLTNFGAFIHSIGTLISSKLGFEVIPSIYPEFAKGGVAIEEVVKAIALTRRILGKHLWAVELNYSCPNSKEEIAGNIKQGLLCAEVVKYHYPDLVLITKVGYVHPREFAIGLKKAGADVIHAINTIPWEILYPTTASPIFGGGGGVSGGPAAELAFQYNMELRRALPDVPLILGCGVVNDEIWGKYLAIGADSVAICTAAHVRPGWAEKILQCNVA